MCVGDGDGSIVGQRSLRSRDGVAAHQGHPRALDPHDAPGRAVHRIVGALDVGDVRARAGDGEDDVGRKQQAARRRSVLVTDEDDALAMHGGRQPERHQRWVERRHGGLR